MFTQKKSLTHYYSVTCLMSIYIFSMYFSMCSMYFYLMYLPGMVNTVVNRLYIEQ